MVKKDYILNIRISKDTYNKLKDRACENRETLSNLARKVIEDGIEIFDDLTKELLGKSTKSGTDVKYYIDVKLGEPAECSNCGKKLKKGSKALLGETEYGRKKYFCTACGA